MVLKKAVLSWFFACDWRKTHDRRKSIANRLKFTLFITHFMTFSKNSWHHSTIFTSIIFLLNSIVFHQKLWQNYFASLHGDSHLTLVQNLWASMNGIKTELMLCKHFLFIFIYLFCKFIFSDTKYLKYLYVTEQIILNFPICVTGFKIFRIRPGLV